MKLFRKTNQKGQTLMEYIIVTGLVGVFCILTVREFGTTLKTKFDSTTKKISKTLDIRS